MDKMDIVQVLELAEQKGCKECREKIEKLMIYARNLGCLVEAVNLIGNAIMNDNIDGEVMHYVQH